MTLFQNAGIALIAAVALAGCAASPRIQDGIVINAPYEAQNRRVHDFNKALDETKPDVVSVNTYPDSHAYFCRKAFNAGCHVFTEKPLATTVDDA